MNTTQKTQQIDAETTGLNALVLQDIKVSVFITSLLANVTVLVTWMVLQLS
jgi:hypothetical protein